MLNQQWIAWTIVLVLMGGILPCSAQAADPDLASITLTAGTPNKTGLHRQLIASGEDKNLPYHVQWADFDSTQPLTEALPAGRVDIAAGGDTGVLFAIANGSHIRILAATQENKIGGSAILVLGTSPIHTVAELKGRKVALPYYTKQHYQFAQALAQAQVPWDARNILNLDTTNGLSALVNGQVDAFVLWDPNTAIAEVEHGARILLPLKQAIETDGMLYAPAQDLDDPLRRLALEDLTRRIIRSQDWVNRHPNEWSQQIATLSQIPLAAAQKQTARSLAEFVPAGNPAVYRPWQKEIDYFHQLGQFRNEFQIRDSIATSFDQIVADESRKLTN